MSVIMAVDIDAILMTLGGIPTRSYRGINPMYIIGIVKMLIAAIANIMYETNLFTIMNYLS